jgi:pimeloyl-ACP methyl ester carboxylesterase
MTLRLRSRAGLLAACILASCVWPADAQMRDIREQPITAGDGTAFVVTSGIVRVPEMRTGSPMSSATIDLAVVRVRRVGATGRTAHVMLAGGPGDSGVNLALGMARQGGAALFELIDGDVIGIDQRGTGKSSPNLASTALYELPLDRPGSPELWLPLMARTARAIAADLTARGIHLDAYNTRESADDVDDVRQALGYARVTVWGRSYGTHLALATLRRHPEMIERLVLVSPEGPDHTWKLPSQVDGVLQRVSERAKLPELLSQMRQVIDRLARTPVVVTVMDPIAHQPATMAIGGFDVQWITAQALADPRAIATLPAAYRQMAAGDFQGIAPLILAKRSRFGVESAMKHLMDLASGASRDRGARIDREATTSLLGDAINFPVRYLGDAWGATDLGDAFRQPVNSDVPVLILAGDLDARTPLENAREIAATLPHSRVVVVENAAHQFDVFGSAPIRAVLAEFLKGTAVTTDRLVLPPLLFQR